MRASVGGGWNGRGWVVHTGYDAAMRTHQTILAAVACSALAFFLGATASLQQETPAPAAPATAPKAGCARQPAMLLESDAFGTGKALPVQCTADGAGTSPSLRWSEPPEGVKSFAVLMDDPDAGGFVHWIIWGIPASARSLPEAMPRDLELKEPAGARQGVTSWGKQRPGYWGSAPGPGSGVHHYTFTLYALDAAIDVPPGATAKQFRKAIKDHVLATAELVGLYERPAVKP